MLLTRRLASLYPNVMASPPPPPVSYASMASRGVQSHAPVQQLPPNVDVRRSTAPPAGHQSSQHARRSPSPSHRPRTTSEDEDVYVLTILTDKLHHDRMTELRTKYFPKRINKLAAHLTLFHALPRSMLESDIVPHLELVASETEPFKVQATHPFRLKRGIAIAIAKSEGGQQSQNVHRRLQQPWLQEGFLSDQDAGGCRVHYTIMNKVDDEADVANALEEVQATFKGDEGNAEGLGLYKYDRGYWKFERKFSFGKTAV